MTTGREAAGAALLALTAEPRPWQELEADIAAAWPGAVIAGDPLRPYAVTSACRRSDIVAVRRDGLPDAPLVAHILGGVYGLATVDEGNEVTRGRHFPTARLWRVSVPASPALSERLAVPDVLLVGLGDRDRYRGARLSLGVTRLASWLRFTHAGRVQVVDYTLVPGDPLETVRRALTAGAPQVLGVGVNFGQWRMLADLAELVEEVTGSWETPPVVVLGNILAAFSPEEAAKPFKAASTAGRVLVSTGLGERPLEALCQSLASPATWPRIPGLIAPGRSAASGRARETVPSLVAPDDGLVLAVAGQGGQVSLETSLGCQYGACTFCPRSHKGERWSREGGRTCTAILDRLCRLPNGPPALSLVDEEFFGAEGLADPPSPSSEAARILSACRDLKLRYELYTRLEQLFDRRRSKRWNLRRAALLAEAAPHMRRLFAGVESASPAQLRRYGKGQTVAQIVDALRVASALGVPLEFGFITLDPLLTAEDLGENLRFLARTDVMCVPVPGNRRNAVAAVSRYLNGADLPASGEPVYRHVAYMATELEVLAGSRYAASLQRRHPELIDGYDAAFARYSVHYADPAIGEIAGWCRVWTEGMFAPVYAARMTARSSEPGRAVDAESLVRRYRDATFTLLLALMARFLPDVAVPELPGSLVVPSAADPAALLAYLSATVTSDAPVFDLSMKGRRRDG